MSHEPTIKEWEAYCSAETAWGGLTSANALRDRRIRNEALEEAAREVVREAYNKTGGPTPELQRVYRVFLARAKGEPGHE